MFDGFIDHDLLFSTIAINSETGKFIYVVIQDYKFNGNEKIPCYYNRGRSRDFDSIAEAIVAMNENVNPKIRRIEPIDLNKYDIVNKVKRGMYVSQFLNKDIDLCRVEVLPKNDYRVAPLFHITRDELDVLIRTKTIELDCIGHDEFEMRYHYHVR